MKYNEKLKILRIQKGWTRKQLAEMVGVSVTTIHRWENGTRKIKLDQFIKLTLIFKVRANYLAGLED